MTISLVFLAIILCQAGQIESKCPINCLKCYLPNKCYMCEPGYYKRTYFNYEECIQCQAGCINCSNWTKCQTCKHEYALLNGVCQHCSANCDSCFYPGTCNTCKHGYYNNKHTGRHNAACTKCYHGCTTCSSRSACISCKNNFVLSNGWCHHCSSNCDKCSQPNRCDTCKPGYYVTSNQNCYQCPEKCNTCLNWTDCQSCISGYYLQFSNCIKCPQQCATCSSESICESSLNGFYLNNKSCLPCPIGCASCEDHYKCTTCLSSYFFASSGRCDECPSFCINCTSRSSCDTCKEGYYGHWCNYRCPEVCLGKVCTKKYGECSQGCVVGYYGYTCNKSCSKGCHENRCNQQRGVCVKGCIDGYYGETCCLVGHVYLNGKCVYCNNCINGAECSSSTGCSQCQDGHWGTYCTNMCGDTCTLCNKYTGECINFTRHTFGRFCELFCSPNCHKISNAASSCFQENGTCLHGCVSGFTGHNCTEEIPISHQRILVLAITGSALGGLVLVAAAAALILLVRSTLNHAIRPPAGVDSNRHHFRCFIRNPTYDDNSTASRRPFQIQQTMSTPSSSSLN